MKIIHDIHVLTTIEELVAPATTALIVVDMQNECVKPGGGYGTQSDVDLTPMQEIVPRIAKLLAAAREAGVLVFYVEFIQRSRTGVSLRDGPSYYVHRNDDFVSCIEEGTWAAQTIHELAPKEGDIVMPKIHPSAFRGTPLNLHLRRYGISSLVITGMSSTGCVAATQLEALESGYYPVLATDAVAAPNRQRHEQLVSWMAHRGPAFTTDEILAQWASA